MKRLIQRLKIAQRYRAKIRQTLRSRSEYERKIKILREKIMQAETLCAKAEREILIHESRNNALIRLAGAQNAQLHEVERLNRELLSINLTELHDISQSQQRSRTH